MTTLGNYHHDFPHLAKQAGFYFQLHNGKVNWAEIENLNIKDIVENRNFQLLEQNLINVINCNLEREYDLEVADKNFVKLFRLAQLGVDYLSYCEAYLDKCVVILQEQLIAFQEECESLKYEKEKREEERSRNKRKNKTLSYQCEKCDKAFISDVYLKFHDKRRHNIPDTPKSFDGPFKTCTDNSQQTESTNKSNTSTQTSLPNDGATSTQDDANAVKIKTQHAVKIENLEQEIQHLKERLKRAENALTEKTETYTSTGFPSPFPGPTCHNTMLLLLPSCQTQSASNYEEVKRGLVVSAPEILRQHSSQVEIPADGKTVEGKPSSQNCEKFNTELEKIFEEKETGLPKAGVKFNDAKEVVESFAERNRVMKERLDGEKENVDPNKGKTVTELNKPLPPPRKLKKVIPSRLDAEENTTVESSIPPKRATQQESEAESFPDHPVMVTSTPVKKKSSSNAMEGSRETLSVLNKQESISNESLYSKKSSLVEDSSTSFFRTIVRKNSPRLRTFGQNLRRSLTNLRDSVSSTGKDLMKKESIDQNVKTAVVSKLNNRLRQLGVDPEWSGIPKKTLKQKLKALKHRRKLLTKENPMYPVIRHNIEESIFEKMRKNLKSKGRNLTRKLGEEASVIDDEPAGQDPGLSNETAGVKTQNCVMYDIESESETKTSDSEIDFDQDMEQNSPPEAVELSGEQHLKAADAKKEFDLTVFQVGRGSLTNMRQKDVSVKVEELLTDSDTDGDFTCEKNFKALNKPLSDKRNDVAAESNDEEQNKSGNQSIFKGTGGFQSTLQLNAKKKVWFVSNSDGTEEGLSDSPNEDEDLWSLKSDWEKNLR